MGKWRVKKVAELTIFIVLLLLIFKKSYFYQQFKNDIRKKLFRKLINFVYIFFIFK